MDRFPDWASVLPDSGAPLPLADDPDFIWSQPSRVRGTFVRLDEVARAAASRHDPAAPLAVYADVLRVDGVASFAVTGLVLHARRIEVGADAAVVVAPPEAPQAACRLSIHAGAWAYADAERPLVLTVGGVPHDLAAGPPHTGVEAEILPDGSYALRETVGTPAGDALTAQIQLNTARRLVHCPHLDAQWSHTLPLQIADWVARTGADPLLRSDARAFAAHLRTPRGRTHFVPYLRLSEYAELAQVTHTALQAVEDEYRSLFNRKLDIEDQKLAAQHLLEHYRAAHAYADKLLQQAADEAASAQQATALAQVRLEERGSDIAEKQEAFEAGIQAKKKELESQTIFGIVCGVLALGAGIAMVCLTGPAGAGVAAGGAAQVAGAGAKTAEQVNRLVELLRTIAKVLDAIRQIKGYYDLLKSAFEAIRTPLDARARAELADQGLPDPLSPEDVMGTADWEEFQVCLDAAFRPALDQRIAGADDFLQAMKKLAIRGRDLVATQAKLDRSQQRFQQCLWQSLRDQADIADMQARIATMVDRAGPGTVLMTYYGQVRDRLKFRLIDAIRDMSDAYRYYALVEPDFTPSIASSGADLASMLSDVRQALVRAKERRGTVGDWGPEGPDALGPSALGALHHGGSMSWHVGTENFAGLERIRVHDIRVWLQGAPGVDRFHVTIGTPGDYVDRLRGKPYEFATWPLLRTFRYERDPNGGDRDAWGQPVRITLKANDSEGDYFEPTAFSTWTIQLPGAYNPGLDLSTITGVALEFIGTAMGARPAAGLRGTAMARGATQRPKRLMHMVVPL